MPDQPSNLPNDNISSAMLPEENTDLDQKVQLTPNPIYHTPKKESSDEKKTLYDPIPKFSKSDPKNTSFKLISAEETKSRYRKDDPPLVDLKVTNPVTYFKKWWNRIFANEGIIFSFRIRPLTAIAMASAIALLLGGTSIGIAKWIFPNASPLLQREVLYQGTLKYSGGDYYIGMGNEAYKLSLPKGLNPTQLLNQTVLVKGNLTKEPNVIKVSEVNAF